MENNGLVRDLERIPRHIAVIMDGNGRWAAKQGVSRKKGHKAGADTLQDITEEAMALGVEYLTVYAFSTENWNRSADEVEGIMDLLRQYLKEHIKTAAKRDVRVRIIGERSRLDQDIRDKIAKLEAITKDKPGLTLVIAINYGGRDELLRAAGRFAVDISKGGKAVTEVDEKLFESYLDTAGIPDPELLIRTSGEKRISNFLLWQLAYTELIFSDKLWPDFSEEDLHSAILEYQSRERRFGGRDE